MQALRAVARAGEIVEDLELAAPGLHDLYSQLVAAAEARP